ncbi:MAG: ComF family protein [Bacteroidota bacterium]|nr:MAG: ComF family protein [Bacteroidota bacterium]
MIPVPLSEKKRLLRGYNQSEHLAIGLGRVLNLRVDTTSLIRSRDTETQTRKTKEQRLDNVADAFQCNPSALYSGIHIGLVDDVFTTEPLEACALAFKSIHAQISILTLAYAIES